MVERGKSIRWPIESPAKDFEELGGAVGLGQKVPILKMGEAFEAGRFQRRKITGTRPPGSPGRDGERSQRQAGNSRS